MSGRPEPADEAAPRAGIIGAAVRIVATDLAQVNKRMVHRAFDVLGGRAAIRSGQEFQALAGHQDSVRAARADLLGSMKRAIGGPPTDRGAPPPAS